ncbi:hypothetical protein AB0B45_47070 [Nonomuraea sp. NPDC049152]|uniref:hypothetical protein n=1 Tax=Nonomuraea sp. NPDC049152 TaxID=3154350 RepID=UPI0033EF0C07
MAYGGIHISSTAIGKIADAVDLYLTTPFRSYHANIRPQTDLPPGTFGMVGDLILGRAYRDVQDTVEKLIGDAIEVTTEWERDLVYARRNWRTAEDLITAEVLAIGTVR